MSEEDLQLLITMDDPGDAPEEDTFNHLQAAACWPGMPFPASRRYDHRAEAFIDNDRYPVAFSQGDWTCTLGRLTGSMHDSMRDPDGNTIQPANKNFEIEFCRVTQRNNGEIVEEKVFYASAGTPK